MAQQADPARLTCPNICPRPGDEAAGVEDDRRYPKAGESRGVEHSDAAPYTPGLIQPPVKKVYPPGAPPSYLPQPTDSTSGDILGMGPIGPWAPGHMDWSPTAGITGVRPVVDKYSITRYSTGEWRKNNQRVLTPQANDKADAMQVNMKRDLAEANARLDKATDDSNKNLEKRVQDVKSWKKKVEKAVKAIDDEIAALDENRAKLKSASKILMLPEAISRECLELRTNRYEPDLVRDDAEQELVKEVAIVGEIRRVFNNTLAKVEEQMANNRAAKAAIEQDWSDKMVSLNVDKTNLSLTPESNLLQYHPGVVRWPENCSSLDYWEHFCRESIRNCEEVCKKSKNLRGDLMTAIVKGGQDLKTQADRTNMALIDSVASTEGACKALEDRLKENLQKIADVESFIDYLKDELRKLNQKCKLGMTRLQSRNYDRKGVENCRDEAQFALMAEAKLNKEVTDSLTNQVREAEAVRSELMQYRGVLEQQIASKRKALNIDRDRFGSIRSFFPSAEEFAAS